MRWCMCFFPLVGAVSGLLGVLACRLCALRGLGAAATAASEDQVFSHWVVQKWDGSSWVDAEGEKEVLPGDTFTVKKDYAQIVVTKWANRSDPEAEGYEVYKPANPQPGTTPPNPNYSVIVDASYTVRLRAEYRDKDHETNTHITWYANNACLHFIHHHHLHQISRD